MEVKDKLEGKTNKNKLGMPREKWSDIFEQDLKLLEAKDPKQVERQDIFEIVCRSSGGKLGKLKKQNFIVW